MFAEITSVYLIIFALQRFSLHIYNDVLQTTVSFKTVRSQTESLSVMYSRFLFLLDLNQRRAFEQHGFHVTRVNTERLRTQKKILKKSLLPTAKRGCTYFITRPHHLTFSVSVDDNCGKRIIWYSWTSHLCSMFLKFSFDTKRKSSFSTSNLIRYTLFYQFQLLFKYYYFLRNKRL